MTVKDMYWEELRYVRAQYHEQRNWMCIWMFLAAVLPSLLLAFTDRSALDFVFAVLAFIILASGVVLSWCMMKFHRRRIKTLEDHPYGD